MDTFREKIWFNHLISLNPFLERVTKLWSKYGFEIIDINNNEPFFTLKVENDQDLIVIDGYLLKDDGSAVSIIMKPTKKQFCETVTYLANIIKCNFYDNSHDVNDKNHICILAKI